VLQKSIKNVLTDEYDSISKIDDSQLTSKAKQQKEMLRDVVHQLTNRLLDVSTLYNSIAQPYLLWESSLLILHICKFDDIKLVNKLWKSIIYR
jgi:hypothetical protein